MEYQKILPNDSSITMFAKMALTQGRSSLEKSEYYDAIVKRAEHLRAPGESPQQSFAKTIVDDPEGRLLYQAMKISRGSEVKAPPDPRQDYVPGESGAKLGPAHAKMHSMAIDHQRANPRLSYESAYSRMYTAPENAGLRAEINREHLAASMAAHG
jgi:hypothetical protein